MQSIQGTIRGRLDPIRTMKDGTIKQVNPFSGTEVWTVPGRGNRPLSTPAANPQPLSDTDFTAHCAFCSDNLLQTPPEKARMVRDGKDWKVLTGLLPGQYHDTVAEFRRVPNLFEILPYDYWHENYEYELDEETTARMEAYIADPAGREHVLSIVRTRVKAAGEDPSAMSEAELLERAPGYFGGGHDLVIGRRHYVDGATTDDQLASSGTLTEDEHRALFRFTAMAQADLYHRNRYVPYVAVFQNWMKPAGASFDHLHKQLVAIDDRSVNANQEIELARANPNMYNEWGVDYAGYQNLVIAENDYAVCFAGFGHRYPTLEVYSKSEHTQPWHHTAEEMNGVSDLVHACHAAAGAGVSCNEEWYTKPIDSDVAMPWRILIKWRVSTLAGFEGGTKIYLNTQSPWTVRDRMVPEFYRLRDEGIINQDIRIATECTVERNSLKYNARVRW